MESAVYICFTRSGVKVSDVLLNLGLTTLEGKHTTEGMHCVVRSYLHIYVQIYNVLLLILKNKTNLQ